ncbi:hypothetical protein K504DRAFT_365482 [Pleomassaria siparia CBS 279.74]|uniref:C2H2-type domain-containing protein n=1 Tax=Pleomassaria siparia CBS 279.74 TaxID=1314801 RepID=A0A6G1KT35_9PLEO|nr:hypothetical protein K504DRAFT_365482 [Pleomassaria siparia CBS 279.74]
MDSREWQQIGRVEKSGFRCDWVDTESGLRCKKLFKRQEHMKRHNRTHVENREHSCMICSKLFNRNDNCRDHYYTHVKKPGKKDGQNKKMPLREVEQRIACTDKGQQLIEKLRGKWIREFRELPVDCL